MKRFLFLAPLALALSVSAANVKISDLALVSTPSTNTFQEIADLNASGTNKSARVFLAWTSVGGSLRPLLPATNYFFGADIFASGTNSGQNITLLGNRAAYQAIFDSATHDVFGAGFYPFRASVIQGASDVSAIGQNSLATSYLTNFADGHAWGNYALYGLHATNSSNIYGKGHSAGQGVVATASGNLFFDGNETGLGSYFTNVTDMSLFNGAMKNATISDSSNFGAFGIDALSGFSGSLKDTFFFNTNMEVFVHGAPIPTPMQPSQSDDFNFLNQLADNTVALSRIHWNGGVSSNNTCYAAGASYTSFGCFINDFALNTRCRPQSFTPKEILDTIAVFVAKQTNNGAIWDAIHTDGITVHGVGNPVAPPLDGIFNLVDLVYTHYLLSGTPSAYNSYVTNLMWGVWATPMLNNLVYITPSTNTVVGWMWEDNSQSCGYNLLCSIELYRSLKHLQEMAVVAGDLTNAVACSNAVALIPASLETHLWDGAGSFFRFSSITNTQHSVIGSAYAVLQPGLVSSTVSNAIVAKLIAGRPGFPDALAGKGFYQNGQVRFMPLPEYFTANAAPHDTFQNGGYWATFAGWVSQAIAKQNPTEARKMLAELVSYYRSTNQTWEPVEWSFNASVGGSNYIASVTGPLEAQKVLINLQPQIQLGGVVSVVGSTNNTFDRGLLFTPFGNQMISVGHPGTAIGASDNLFGVVGTGSSTTFWRGMAQFGGDNNKVVVGEYNSQAWIGANNAALAAWADLYINPLSNTENTFIGTVNGSGSAVTVKNSDGTTTFAAPVTATGGVTVTNTAASGASFTADQFTGATNYAIADFIAGTSQFKLYGGGANVMDLRNGTSPQAINVFNTFTSSTDYEKGQLAWGGNQFYVGTVKAGSGQARQMNLMVNGNPVWILDTSGNLLDASDNSTDIGILGSGRPRNIYAGTGYGAGGVAGITTIWTNMISGVITQRLSTIGGIVVTNLTL